MFYSEYILKHYQQQQHHQQQQQSSSSSSSSSHGDITSNEDFIDQCPFIENGYVDTIRDIASRGQLHQQNADLNPPPPLLLIYLHAPLHEKVPQFLNNVFCNPRIISLIHRYKNSGALTCWGGSIHTADGAHARDTLQVTCFPFLALVRVEPDRHSSSSTTNANQNDSANIRGSRNLELLFRMEGPALQSIQPNALFVHLSNALVKYEAILTEQTMRRLQRQEEVRLREEQDREYREALEADQRREREKQEQQRLKEEQERKIREEQERIAHEKQSRLENARRILNRNGEGEPSDGNDDSVVQARIRLVLPSGKRLERRFRGNDTIDVVRSFLILHFEENDIPIENFELSSNYPKKALTDGDKTLESEGLCPHAVIMVQDLDA
jgi:FAS-associated factor 2